MGTGLSLLGMREEILWLQRKKCDENTNKELLPPPPAPPAPPLPPLLHSLTEWDVQIHGGCIERVGIPRQLGAGCSGRTTAGTEGRDRRRSYQCFLPQQFPAQPHGRHQNSPTPVDGHPPGSLGEDQLSAGARTQMMLELEWSSHIWTPHHTQRWGK